MLFNRFYRFDIDLDTLQLTAGNPYSTPDEQDLPLRWISLPGALTVSRRQTLTSCRTFPGQSKDSSRERASSLSSTDTPRRPPKVANTPPDIRSSRAVEPLRNHALRA